ncbi:acyl transferase domain-containing protein|uniref:Acyl transferase domain-containing protein n=1 Tax=Brenneria salicis ATCC 15712 = DSM 30166 TaxID=714314 RepID=A0A366HZK3_9GAMM|nr:type I polyketide synthase [Brenneria salicis]NMN92810.1 acyl transferase domain-containing protein [Brenneria salicis ATCC 15712 = DSM 30166]RBP59744.1 acyl transferase domain-containing protein [Brenneria salicis ATCC 15712 = DSM 30166]RLM29851.1 beta-ketoacyl synthase [Brenneria salicis ATCC 15712 = DSM 30166]
MKDQVTFRDKDIAVVGMSARFPGAEDVTAFWRNLLEGVETISTFSEEELRESGIEEDLIASSNYIRRRGILGNAQDFDAHFFDITPRDAEIMDPQHRIFLECCWHAFENAGYVPDTYPGKVGVFGGTGTAWHLNKVNTHPEVQKYASGASVVTNNDKDYVTTRVSYKLNLKGPSINVQSACSTAMVAVVMGINSLQNGESDLIVAGGVSVDTPERRGYQYMQGGMESADGRCYAFDSRANGTVFSRGAGVVLLKRLNDAIRDGDHIYAVLKGGAINNDGSLKAGYTAPGVAGQVAVARQAITNAQINPATIDFVEAHGTATALGDPIEFTSLTQTFQEYTDKTQYCRLGSVKTNIGHTDAASGMASLIKASLALETGMLPASLHFVSPNPNIEFETSPFIMNTELSKLDASDTPHRALVNSFGVGGTNACVVLEAAPPLAASDPHHGLLALPFSAKSRKALEEMKQRMHDYLSVHENVNLADVAYTLQVGRQKFAHSTVIVAGDRETLLNKLAHPSAIVSQEGKNRKSVVFMFPGQGNQYLNMAHELYTAYGAFRQVMDQCCRYLEPILGVDLKTVMFSKENAADRSRLNETEFTQPSLFVVEYSLAQLWISWGIKPDAMIGHSVGECVAACISGVFSLEDALKAVALRGKMVQALPSGDMLAVLMDEETLSGKLQGGKLEMAAVNYPGLCVIAGESDEIARFQQRLEDNNIFCKHLDTSHAFHSYMMEPMLPAFKKVIDTIALHAPQIPFVSTVNGEWISDELAQNSDYWVRHVRNTVQFSHAFKTLMAKAPQDVVFLEVGPGRSLESSAKQHFNANDGALIYSSLPTAKDAELSGEYLLSTFGALWASGVDMQWSPLSADQHRRRLPLPGYPFERKRFTLPMMSQDRPDVQSVKARKRKKADTGDWFSMPTWKQTIPAKFMAGTRVQPGDETCWLILADNLGIAERTQHSLENQGHKVLSVTPGAAYQEDPAGGRYVIHAAQREDYIRLLKSLKTQGLRPSRILYLWSLTAETPTPRLNQEQMISSVNAFYRPLYLQQALVSENLLDELHLLFATSNTFSVMGEAIASPENALLVGPARVFYHEYPEVQCHLVDIDLRDGRAALDDIAQHLIAESDIATHGNLVAYRGGQRWEEGYQAVHLDQDDSGIPADLRDDGVYLITGGLGGLGMLVANYVAENSNAALILTYRSALPPRDSWHSWVQQHPVDDEISEKIAGVLRLEAQGNTVHLAQVDVSDYAGMRDMLAAFPRVDGVFHTAGVAGGGIIPLKSDADCTSVLDPKVAGSVILDALLQNKQPDFFILFSSITAIVGDEARIDYCSGNAFMDAFAHYRNQHRRGRTVSLNWGKWGDVGMAARWTRQQLEKKNSKSPVFDEVEGDLLTLVEREGMQESYQVNLAVRQDWVIDEHRLAHQPSLVGATLLSLLHEFMTQFKPQESLQVKNLMLTKPVIYRHAWPRLMRLVITADGKGYKFSLKSRGTLELEWQEHAFGVIGQDQQASEGIIQPIDDIRRRCTTEMPYAPLPMDLENATTGDVFLSLSQRWNNHRDIVQGHNEWLVHNVLDQAYVEDMVRYPYHPAIIDATAIHCLMSITQENFLPISYGKITFLAPLNDNVYAHVKLKRAYQAQDNAIVMDIVFLSPQGRPLLALENYTLLKLTPDNQVATPQATSAFPVKVNLADKDILLPEGVDILKRQLSHLEFAQLVIVTSDLDQIIYESIPEQATPEHIVLDNAALEGHSRPALSVDYQAPGNDIEKEIVNVWQSILGISGIGVNDSFTELGGNSLLAVQVISTVSGIFEIDIRVDLFYQNQTIKGLSTLILSELETLLQN